MYIEHDSSLSNRMASLLAFDFMFQSLLVSASTSLGCSLIDIYSRRTFYTCHFANGHLQGQAGCGRRCGNIRCSSHAQAVPYPLPSRYAGTFDEYVVAYDNANTAAVIILFFLWGFAYGLPDVLNSHFQLN